MKAMPKLASLVALCCLLPLFALGEAPLFLDSPSACSASLATAQASPALPELDPLAGASSVACNATATCGSFYPNVSCSGNSSCTSKDRSCPNVYGWVNCDGNITNCAVNQPCVENCNAARESCLSGCPPLPPGNPCRIACQEASLDCTCACYF
jgi:hypothetical protein